MVSTRPSPSPTRGRIPYPSADSYTPGDSGVTPALNPEAGLAPPPSGAASRAPVTSTSTSPSATPTPATEDSDMGMGKEGSSGSGGGELGRGLRRLASVRRRSTRDKDKEKGKDRETPGSEAADKDPPKQEQREMTERERSTQGLRTWWKHFLKQETTPAERSFRRAPQTMNTRRVFGVPLAKVLSYAAMQISTSAPDGSLYVWGEVPIIVGRCGSYLKAKTDIEGVFRVSGSAKRMRDLQIRFDEGPKFGIDLDWATSPYTPHDVATILRRYLTQMPEPVIPFQFYNAFRAVQVSDHTPDQKVREYKKLFKEMPRENQYLLLYLLDLLGIFARESDKNLMTAANLAVIFQPGILSHPGHDMRPAESAISKDVVEFLIDNQAHFVFGMSKRMSNATRRTKSATTPTSAKNTPISSRRPSDDTAAVGRVGTPVASSSRPPAIPEDREASPQKTAPLPIPVVSPMPIPSSSASTSPLIPGIQLASSPEPHAALPAHGSSPGEAKLPGILARSPGPGSGTNTGATTPAPPALPSPSLAPEAVRASAASPVSIGSERTSLTLQRPPPVRADTDFMLPSDSDDDAPPGGYYIVERSTSPHRATSPFPPSPEPGMQKFALQSILPPPRPPRRSKERSRPSTSASTRPQAQGSIPAVDVMQPSDSDDDEPAGGYVVFENRPGTLRTSAMGRAHSAAASPNAASRPSPTSQTTAELGRSRTVLQPGEGRANSPKVLEASGGATGLFRRRTLPTKRVSDFTARMRRAVREA